MGACTGDDRLGLSPPQPRRHETEAAGAASVRLLCLGNDLLADDALGIVVAEEVERRTRGAIDVVRSSLSGFGLLDDLLNASRMVVVDTILTGKAEPGTIYVLQEGDLQGVFGGSPHYVGLFETLALGRELRLVVPDDLVIVAVEAADCSTVGGAMHPAVKASVPKVLKLVQQIVRSLETEE